MKIVLALAAMVVAACTAQRLGPQPELTVTRSAQIKGISDKEMMARSIDWMQRHLFSKEPIIRRIDRSAGIIEAGGVIDYPDSGGLGGIARVQHTISFTMTTAIRGGQVDVRFSDILLDIPKYYYPRRFLTSPEYYGGYSVPVTEREDVEASQTALAALADRLIGYLMKGE